jgi:hypothetical protein
LRSEGEYSLVSERKMGLPPNGFTIGKSTLRMKTMLFAVSTTTAPFANNPSLVFIPLPKQWFKKMLRG